MSEKLIQELETIILEAKASQELGRSPASELVRVKSAIERLSRPGSVYVVSAFDQTLLRTTGLHSQLNNALACAEALLADIKAGYIQTTLEILRADLYSDFVGMSSELLNKGYYGPAAVLLGAVLEEHLRKLSEGSGLPVVKENGEYLKMSSLNSNLYTASVYSNLVRAKLDAWIAIRNSAAHGKFSDFSEQDVQLMREGLIDFLDRYPA